MKKVSVTRQPSFSATAPALSQKSIDLARAAVRTKEGATKLMQDAGILNKSGNLAKPYKQAS